MKRPLGITLVSLLSFLNGALILVFAVMLLLNEPTASKYWLGIIEIVLGLLYFITGYGLWRLKNWGLGLAMLLQVLSVAISLGDLRPGFVGGLLILSYLAFSPTVKKVFRDET